MSPWLLWGLLVPWATFRLTVLVTTDRIGQTVRRKIAGWSPTDDEPTWIGEGRDVDLHHIDRARRPKLAYLVKCDWCSSFWLSWLPAVAAVLWPDNRAVWAVLLALTASAFTGIVSTVVTLMIAATDRLDG